MPQQKMRGDRKAFFTGARVSRPPSPCPPTAEIVTVLRATHMYKDSREQFESRTHKRLIDILKPSNKTVEALMSLQLPRWRGHRDQAVKADPEMLLVSRGVMLAVTCAANQ